MNDKKQKQKNSRIHNIEKTLESLTVRRSAPKSVFFILLILYLVAAVIISVTAGLTDTVTIFGYPFAIYAFAGVFSALSNICVILMAVYCGKGGYYTALFLLTAQLPIIMMGVVRQHNLNSLPGIFGNILAILAITVVYINNKGLERAYDKIRDQMVTDTLTGIPNRAACGALIKELIKKGDKFTIVIIDLNNFKSINDSIGFSAGNTALIEIASRWKNIADSGLSGTLDFITRIGGDEFALIIRNYHSDQDVRNTIRQYEAALSSRLTIEDCDFYIAASFGYAEFPTDGNTNDTIATCATAAMKEVKRANISNHILKYTPELFRTEQTLAVENKIRNALENDTIYFNLQPQYDLSHKLRGFEALARMRDNDGSVISPGEFIPVAEKVGLVDRVDAAVFRKSALFFGDMLRKYHQDITLSVNVSVRHLMKNDFLEEVKEVLRISGVPANQIEIEITESIMIDSVDKAMHVIGEIEQLGIRIAIDDFGTGYSSLSYLNKFPANLLKVDKSFIDKMNTSDSSKQYVAAIISIGHIMGFEVISEGVEDPDQLETLKEIGCDYIQGYIWGRPLPKEEAEQIVFASSQSTAS